MNKFSGQIGETTEHSTPWWPSPDLDSKNRPNIVTVVFDDTGWSDFGCFGSEIKTPTLDLLAKHGLRYTNFHVTALCSPTRASLMTGCNHHRVGMRCLADTDTGFPNSRGAIPEHVPLLPEMLRATGYGTYMVGKWHLAPAAEVSPAGPHHHWPLRRGFDQYYGFLSGCTNHYVPELCQDNHSIDPPHKAGYHLTEDLCEKAVYYVRDHIAFRDSSPFYLNLCFGATHAPIQVEQRYIDPYVPIFDIGWDQIRENRLIRQKHLGLVPEDTELAPRNPGVPAWNTLTKDQTKLYTRLQAAYAGFLEHTDEHLGRFVTELKRLGVFDNTLVIVIADNGASPEGSVDGAVNVNSIYSGAPESVSEQIPRINTIGGPEGPAHYPQGWAMAGNTPFRRYKQFVELGGVRSPMILSWPNQMTKPGETRDQFLHVIDLAPTIMAMAGNQAPKTFDGRSFETTINNPDSPSPRTCQYWEMFGRRAIYSDGWKAVSNHEKGDDYASDKWQLYDTKTDFSETHDVSHIHPEKLKELVDLWWKEAEKNEVMPLDDRTIVDIIRFRQPAGLMSRRMITLYPGQGRIPTFSMVTGSDRSMEATVKFQSSINPNNDEGVLLASGDCYGGYSLYIKSGLLHYEHIRMGDLIEVIAELPDSLHQCSFVLIADGTGGAEIKLFANKNLIGSGQIPKTSHHLSFCGLDVGRDSGLAVSKQYEGPFNFSEQLLDHVVIRFFEDLTADDIAESLITSE